MSRITLLLTLIMLLISSITDFKYRKVFNEITFSAMILGLLFNGFPLSACSYYRLLWMLIFFLMGSLGIMGMGDLKLCMAVIAMRGIEEASMMLLFGIFFLFLYCLFDDRKNTLFMIKDTYNTIFYHTPVIKRSDKKYPFAVFLSFGYIAGVLVRWCLIFA